jgi:hypothetical protein
MEKVKRAWRKMHRDEHGSYSQNIIKVIKSWKVITVVIVMLCGLPNGYQHFRSMHYLHLQTK